MKLRFCIIALLLTPLLSAQNTDSLWHVFNDETEADTVRLRSIHQLARSYIHNNPDTALHYAQLQEAFAKQTKNSRWLSNAYNTLGSAYTVKGELRDAMDKFSRMLELRRDISDTSGMATAHNNIGNVYFLFGDYRKALENYILSQQFEQLTGELEGQAISYINIGSIYAQLAEPMPAILYFKRADTLAGKLNDMELRGSCYANLGTAYKAQDSLTTAYTYFHKAIPLLESAKNDHSLAILYLNLADIHRQRAEYDLMFDYYEKSYQMRLALGDQQGIARVYVVRGSAFQLMGRFKAGRDECLRGLRLAETLEASPVIRDACECLYAVYKGLGDNETALGYYERLNSLSDEMAEAETQKELQIMEFRQQVTVDSIAREAETRELEGRHALEIRKQGRTRNVLMISGLLLLTVSIVLYRRVRRVRKSKIAIEEEKHRTDKLLLSILPADITKELLEKGKLEAREFDQVTVLFTDFISFTSISRTMETHELVTELNNIFMKFDEIVGRHGIQKIKSIGDAYMAAGGFPVFSPDTVRNTALAALELQDFIEQHYRERHEAGLPGFHMRVGLHHGAVVAGIVGFHNFQYDIWGDTVNLASRIEKAGVSGKVNISKSVHDHIANDPTFVYESRGVIDVKGKGGVEMWFVAAK